jgi:3',5'-cyclic-AMP phosphodiesterase
VPKPMHPEPGGGWTLMWDPQGAADGLHEIHVEAEGETTAGTDTISVALARGVFAMPERRHPVDFENTVGAWPEKKILGTQLGPNENGTKGPWPSWR